MCAGDAAQVRAARSYLKAIGEAHKQALLTTSCECTDLPGVQRSVGLGSVISSVQLSRILQLIQLCNQCARVAVVARQKATGVE